MVFAKPHETLLIFWKSVKKVLTVQDRKALVKCAPGGFEKKMEKLWKCQESCFILLSRLSTHSAQRAAPLYLRIHRTRFRANRASRNMCSPAYISDVYSVAGSIFSFFSCLYSREHEKDEWKQQHPWKFIYLFIYTFLVV